MTDYSGTISVPATGYYLDEWTVRTQERRKSDNKILPSNSTTPASDGTYTLTSPDIYDRYVKLIPEQPKGSDWQASTAYSLGDYVHPTTFAGYVFRCTTAGTSGGTEPTWDETHGNTTSDNTVTWTAVTYLGEAAGQGKFWQGEYEEQIDVVGEFFGGAQDGLWYDPSDLSTLFQDDAGTTAVTADGDPVGRMEDKSGNGHHATQATASLKPVYRTDGTAHWLEFDGTEDRLRIDTAWTVGTNPHTIVVAFGNYDIDASLGGYGGIHTFFNLGNQDSNGGLWNITAEMAVRVGGGFSVFSTMMRGGRWTDVVSTVFPGGGVDVVGNTDMRVGGNLLEVESSQSQVVDLLAGGYIGAAASGGTNTTGYTSGGFFGSIVVLDVLSDAKRQAAENWAASKGIFG